MAYRGARAARAVLLAVALAAALAFAAGPTPAEGHRKAGDLQQSSLENVAPYRGVSAFDLHPTFYGTPLPRLAGPRGAIRRLVQTAAGTETGNGQTSAITGKVEACAGPPAGPGIRSQPFAC